MKTADWIKLGAAALIVAAGVLGAAAPASAKTIIDEWASVKAPPAPTLKSVTVDPKTTALLVLDLVKKTCNEKVRPRCFASLPKIKAFLAQARAHKMLVIYSLYGGTTADIDPSVAPLGSEPVVTSHANKFIHTDLEKTLRTKNIKTIIPVGTVADGAVLFTASQAALLGFKVIVPVDGSSAISTYAEQATAWILATAPTVGQNVTLTRFDLIGW
ncbi:MAG TPA: isochorismatase family protein [Beijerinckiaceae bacterium]|nr:isochorismatase family protein [Beijerinckiaceae bacterium]